MWLWGLNSLIILAEVSKQQRLVLYVDSSKKRNLGFSGTPWKKKMLLTKVYW